MKEKFLTVGLLTIVGILGLLLFQEVLSTSQILGGDMALLGPHLLTTTQRFKQSETLKTMFSITEALGQYHDDHGAFPNRTSLFHLNREIIQPYYSGNYHDAWGTLYQYFPDGQGYEYTLMSYGKDRVRGNEQNEFDADIIIRNGNIIAPESLTNQCRNTQKTVRILRWMGTALGSYQVDYDIFPLASSMMPFNPQVVSRFYYIDVYTDAWGTPIEYKTFNRGADYELRSLGKDRLKGNGSSVFDADILFQDGQLLATLPDDCPEDPYNLLKRTRADMRAIGTALGSYQVDYDTYPAFPMQINLCDTPLFSQYTKFYYSGSCRDAWNTPYQYLCPDGQSYTVTSYGKDGKPGVTDHDLDQDILHSNGQLMTP